MLYDGHIHIMSGADELDVSNLKMRMLKSGIEGGSIISYPPVASYTGKTFSWEERLAQVIKFAEGGDNLFPMFWINPLDYTAQFQVDAACEQGIAGFKIICDDFVVSDEHALSVIRYIASKKKPILFHSGILWDGKVSSKNSRPIEFERLLEVEGLKFALAHVSWPWCDECIAMYGKFLNAYTHSPELSVEMFIDITPGTPPIYREEVLKKLFLTGYDIENNVIFGTDCFAKEYNSEWAAEWIERDNGIYDKIGIGGEVRGKIYSENLLRFYGKSDKEIKMRLPVPS